MDEDPLLPESLKRNDQPLAKCLGDAFKRLHGWVGAAALKETQRCLGHTGTLNKLTLRHPRSQALLLNKSPQPLGALNRATDLLQIEPVLRASAVAAHKQNARIVLLQVVPLSTLLDIVSLYI